MNRMRKTPKPSRGSAGRRNRPNLLLRLAFLAGIAVLASSIWDLWQLHAGINQRLAGLNAEKARLMQQQQDLKEEIARLNTPSYIEQLAREQLGLVRRGEILIAPKQK